MSSSAVSLSRSLLRGQVLGPWYVDKAVLNAGGGAKVQEGMMGAEGASKLAQDMRLSMLKIKAQSISEDGMSVNYKAISTSSAFSEFKKLTWELRRVDPSLLEPDARKAFMINVYNALTVHSIIEGMCVPAFFSDTLGRLRLYAKASYEIGGIPYSLNEIENGILRGNRKSAAPLTSAPFAPGDSRLALCLECDCRIHFALNCGAKGCPPIAFYDPNKLEDELNTAQDAFMLGGGVEVTDGGEALSMSMIFKWYEEDFRGGALEYVLASAPDGLKDKLDPSKPPSKMSFQPYNWAIND